MARFESDQSRNSMGKILKMAETINGVASTQHGQHESRDEQVCAEMQQIAEWVMTSVAICRALEKSHFDLHSAAERMGFLEEEPLRLARESLEILGLDIENLRNTLDCLAERWGFVSFDVLDEGDKIIAWLELLDMDLNDLRTTEESIYDLLLSNKKVGAIAQRILRARGDYRRYIADGA